MIVLYKTTADHCVSLQSLQRAALQIENDALDLLIVLHDNTPGAQAPDSLPSNVLYIHDKENGGLAGAYNYALSLATARGYEWLLTLDQDTDLPLDALDRYLLRARELSNRPDVAAVVPQIVAEGRIVSPNYFAGGAWPRWFATEYSGVPDQSVYAFNSGSLLRTAALRQIGGYSPWFWLDNSDSATFRKLSKYGKRVYVAGDLKLQHDFSMLNMSERISPERYETILLSESAFWDMEMNRLAGFERTARLVGRLGKHWKRRDPIALRRLTWATLRSRLFRSRKTRLRRWQEITLQRIGGAARVWKSDHGPKVSVCMAAYNGERFIEAQLNSIVPQLSDRDEIVIVNDASKDGTAESVRSLQRRLSALPAAPQVWLIEHDRNRGVVATFEDALRSATGDILFLADDDDLWAPDKVSKILKVFGARPEVQLVSTGLQVIDDAGQPVRAGALFKHRKFSAKVRANLVHNQFQGSAMAFRASLLQHILPFPSGRLFLHDAWIGLLNTLTGGKAAYLDEPLLLYRRHDANYSRRLSRWKQLGLRVQLVQALLGRWTKDVLR